ncbi:MAG TPA: hypothetical protein VKE51_08835 [Vicinamibacterales bacterium]|nr:hypothetical protein [Vicinamibacterales bacterium]
MRAIAAAAALGAIALVPCTALAQERAAQRPAHVRPGVPVVTVADSLGENLTEDDAAAAARKFVAEWSERLRPLEQRLREDRRLRSAGAIVGLSAAAIGAVRGQQTLTFIGTQAIRLGLDRQLTTIRARSGFEIQPTIGRRGFSVTVSKDLSR